MRSVFIAAQGLALIAAAVLPKSTDAFSVPSGSAGSAMLPTSPFVTQHRRHVLDRTNNLVVLSAGFFSGGGSGGNNENQGKEQQRAPGGEKISQKRRAQLGINADEDEYDLYYALDQNTDPIITKVIAGSFILVMIALLVYGVVIPSLTVYDEGVCSPIQNAGRC